MIKLTSLKKFILVEIQKTAITDDGDWGESFKLQYFSDASFSNPVDNLKSTSTYHDSK